MKALILAAGFGTRLLPYTSGLPKPLFTLNQRPVLDFAIEQLVTCGCDEIFINTHHCHEQIEAFVRQHRFKDRIQTIYEPKILDTGGAIANVRRFLDNAPFFVINADIISDIDLKQVYECHLAACLDTKILATLVVHDYPEFNKIRVDGQGFIENFNAPAEKGLAFTGVQILSPEIFAHMPAADCPEASGIKAFSSIEIYKKLCPAKKIKAFVADKIFWRDIGTIPAYRKTSQQFLCAHLLGLSTNRLHEIQITPIAGDGSDRHWYRACHENRCLVLSDHGICPAQSESLAQLQAFVSIGAHLASKKITVPKVLGHDTLSGQVALEDLGDVHLASVVQKTQDTATIITLYQRVIDQLVEFSQIGRQDFDMGWTCQTASYSKELILEKECAYFMTEFVQGFHGKKKMFDSLAHEFEFIADNALTHCVEGLMHRDMQSKNIMIHGDNLYFIDFQSARKGPLQYDLASLLIDPYVQLPESVQQALVQYTMSRLKILSTAEQSQFNRCYQFCCLTRNLQFLGAFAFLSRRKGKKSFEAYIPQAVRSLKSNLERQESLPGLKKLVNTL
jgi:aminoglycoside/choline kinase family phosphotransferase/dTDP-glucose pyrophosphorylase